jgi:5-methylcytosine-specific restriction endonuclease McrA
MPTKTKYKKNNKKYKKKSIPKALREQVWIHHFGEKFKHSCYIPWCTNTINVFDYHVGHNIPESKGGKLQINNLKPICSRCNHSMGSQYTITEWIKLNSNSKQSKCCPFF